MKVAIPVWQNRVAPLFDVCSVVKILDTNQQWAPAKTLEFKRSSVGQRLSALYDVGVEVVVCNGISLFLKCCLQSRSILVLCDQDGNEKEVVQKIKDELQLINEQM
ncbi:NifB/NifX family molybdenum-iron cluster-binding protein [Calditrichota bacterium GD2]